MKIKKEMQKINQSAGGIRKSLTEEIQKHLTQGKAKLNWLEEQLRDEKNHKKLQAQLGNVKEKVNQLKETFVRFEEKAVHYTEKNPKKALAMATTAGLLAAALWNSFQKPEPTSKSKTLLKTKKRPTTRKP